MTQKKIDAPAKRRPGRPPRADGPATRMLPPIRVTDAEHEAARDLAAARGVDVATLIRNLLAAATRRADASAKSSKRTK